VADSAAVWTFADFEVRRNDRRVSTVSTQSTITAVQLDREGSMWIGTQATGLHRLKRALFTVFRVARDDACYSCRSARIGSMREARRAGTKQASAAIATRTTDTTATVGT